MLGPKPRAATSPDSPSVTPPCREQAAVRVLGSFLHASGRPWQLWESRQCLIWQKGSLRNDRSELSKAALPGLSPQ